MINKCCICGDEVLTKTEIPFTDLLGSGVKNYSQKVGVCQKCGFIFTQNPYTDEQLANRYKNVSKFEYDASNYILDNDYPQRCHRQKRFLDENINLKDIKSLLEVGAASGYNLSLYKENNIVLGIEPSALNCDLAKKNYNVNMFCGMFDEYIKSSKRDKYDLVFLSMILEHIVNPKLYIEEIRNINNKYIFIEVPTLDIRMDEEPFGIFCEEHVNIFTIDSLNHLMNSCGYRLLNVENIYGIGKYLPAGYPSMMTLWEKCEENKILSNKRYNIFSSNTLLDLYIKDSLKGLKRIRKIIDSIPDRTRLGIWGIGHHASMLISNTSLSNKNIVKVYDSDERKAGVHFVGHKIEPFQIEDVTSGKIEALLITTYTAQSAIERYIKKIGVSCRLYLLYDI